MQNGTISDGTDVLSISDDTDMFSISDRTDMFQAHLAWFGYVYPVLNCGETKYPDVSVKDTA